MKSSELDLYNYTYEQIIELFEDLYKYKYKEMDISYKWHASRVENSPWDFTKVTFPASRLSQLVFIYYCSESFLPVRKEIETLVKINLKQLCDTNVPNVIANKLIIFEDKGDFDYEIFSNSIITKFFDREFGEIRFINFKMPIRYNSPKTQVEKFSFFNVNFSVIREMKDCISNSVSLQIDNCFMTKNDMKLIEEYCNQNRYELTLTNIESNEKLTLTSKCRILYKLHIDHKIQSLFLPLFDLCVVYRACIHGTYSDLNVYSLLTLHVTRTMYHMREVGLYSLSSDHELFLLIYLCMTSEENMIELLDFSGSNITFEEVYLNDERILERLWIVEKLKTIPRLKMLILKDTKIKPETIIQIQQQLPGIKVEYN